jgi:hypothetical protein
MKYILFETFTGRICMGRINIEDEEWNKPFSNESIISVEDVMVVQSMKGVKGWELAFFPYYYPYDNAMETFDLNHEVYKWKIASDIMEKEYVHILTGIVTDVKKIIT